MSTFSSAASAIHTFHKQRILDSISSQVSAGGISSTDETALDSAVETIDRALSSSSSSSSTSSKLNPSDMKSRVDDLIAQQVSAGALTSDEATTLKSVFAQGHGGRSGGGGPGGGGVGGPPPGPPPSDPSSTLGDPSSDASTTSGSDSTGSTTESASDLLANFMKQLQASQSPSSSGYGSSGSSSSSSGGSKLVSALLLNFDA